MVVGLISLDIDFRKYYHENDSGEFNVLTTGEPEVNQRNFKYNFETHLNSEVAPGKFTTVQ